MLQIVMHSLHDQTHATYEADLENNVTKLIVFPDGIVLDNAPIAPDEINNQTQNMKFTSLLKRELSSRFVPATGYR